MQVIHPTSVYNKPQIESRNKMILQTAYCTLIWQPLHVIFTLDISIKKKVQNLISVLLLAIRKYLTICTSRNQVYGRQSHCLKRIMLVIYFTTKVNLQSPDFLSLTQQFLVFIFIQLLTSVGSLLISTCCLQLSLCYGNCLNKKV